MTNPCIYIDEKWPDERYPNQVLMATFFTNQIDLLESIDDYVFNKSIGSFDKLNKLIESVNGYAMYTYTDIPKSLREGKFIYKGDTEFSRNNFLWCSMLSASIMATINTFSSKTNDFKIDIYHHQYDMNVDFDIGHKLVIFKQIPELLKKRNQHVNIKIDNIVSVDLKDSTNTDKHAIRGVRICDKLCYRYDPKCIKQTDTKICFTDITKQIETAFSKAENHNL